MSLFRPSDGIVGAALVVGVGVVVDSSLGFEVGFLFPRYLDCPLLAYPLPNRVGLVCTGLINPPIKSAVGSNCVVELSVGKAGIDVLSPSEFVSKSSLLIGHILEVKWKTLPC